MRGILISGCLGLVSISAFAGCGLFSKSRDDASYPPVPRLVMRNGVPVSGTANATISGSSQPIGTQAEKNSVPEPAKLLPAPGWLPAIPAPPIASSNNPAGSTRVDPRSVLPSPTELEKARSAGEAIVDSSAPPRFDISDNDPRVKPTTIASSSVHIQTGHSEDFKTVTGQVQRWRSTVRIRYAPIDQEDVYGGFVVLEGGAELTKMRDGQHVRIRGVLIAPEDRNTAAHFRVQGLEILD